MVTQLEGFHERPPSLDTLACSCCEGGKSPGQVGPVSFLALECHGLWSLQVALTHRDTQLLYAHVFPCSPSVLPSPNGPQIFAYVTT